MTSVQPGVKEAVERIDRFVGGEMCAVIYASRDVPDGSFRADLRTLLAALSSQAESLKAMASALERIATVDQGGAFLNADACRFVARTALSTHPQPER